MEKHIKPETEGKLFFYKKTFDYDGITQRGFIVATNDWQSTYTSYPIDMDGKIQCWSHQRPEDIFDGSDLVSEWKKKINEKKLDCLARKNCPYDVESDNYGYRLPWFEGFESGYKLAIKNK